MPPTAAVDHQIKADPASPGIEPTVTLAVVIGAHGIHGQVRLKVFAEDLGPYRSFNDGTLTLKNATPGNNGTIARFAEIADRTAAEICEEVLDGLITGPADDDVALLVVRPR